jgi:lysophospholipase L1-like esterase
VQGVAAPVDPSLIDLWAGTGRADPPVPEGPPGSRLVPEVIPDLGLDAHARAVHEQYDRTRRLSAQTARLHGVLPRYFWQPSRYSRDLVLEEPHFDTASENGLRAEDQTMSSHVADDVVDLTDALDDNDEPLFTDDVHHNEKGARLIAEAIFASLRADLELLASEDER